MAGTKRGRPKGGQNPPTPRVTQRYAEDSESSDSEIDDPGSSTVSHPGGMRASTTAQKINAHHTPVRSGAEAGGYTAQARHEAIQRNTAGLTIGGGSSARPTSTLTAQASPASLEEENVVHSRDGMLTPLQSGRKRKVTVDLTNDDDNDGHRKRMNVRKTTGEFKGRLGSAPPRSVHDGVDEVDLSYSTPSSPPRPRAKSTDQGRNNSHVTPRDSPLTTIPEAIRVLRASKRDLADFMNDFATEMYGTYAAMLRDGPPIHSPFSRAIERQMAFTNGGAAVSADQQTPWWQQHADSIRHALQRIKALETSNAAMALRLETLENARSDRAKEPQLD